ncbi:MAG: 4-(cytidine 5'-diphospho)-2-C-methyl-D-erythritol kinase [Bacteroidales bacterium]|nr:4-(cytidine 5'-diphospho)-2-C-methyl-D-erythritol kinase [Bacteroidales bacterium]
MITFSNAKINIGLNIVSKRSDGYHNLETVYYPIPIEDSIEIHLNKKQNAPITLYTYGKKIEGEIADNLIIKVYNLIKKDFDIPCLNVYLSKNIPSGAGLGGGSSNAAFMLKLLNRHFNLNIPIKKLEKYAKRLGADCPFFIQNKPVFAQGIGDLFSPIDLDLKDYNVVIIKSDLFISTQKAFSKVQIQKPKNPLLDCINLPIHKWKKYISNDFENSVFPIYPELKEIKKYLYESGALFASMSGSGPSIYGIYSKENDLPDFSMFKEHYICKL